MLLKYFKFLGTVLRTDDCRVPRTGADPHGPTLSYRYRIAVYTCIAITTGEHSHLGLNLGHCDLTLTLSHFTWRLLKKKQFVIFQTISGFNSILVLRHWLRAWSPEGEETMEGITGSNDSVCPTVTTVMSGTSTRTTATSTLRYMTQRK